MSEQTPQAIVHAYLDAIETRDFERARSYLSDERFHYCGPVRSFDDADQFIANVWHVGAILEGIERRKTLVDGNEVCDILDFRTRFSELVSTRVVQWTIVEDGKIVSIETFYNTLAYARLFAI